MKCGKAPLPTPIQTIKEKEKKKHCLDSNCFKLRVNLKTPHEYFVQKILDEMEMMPLQKVYVKI